MILFTLTLLTPVSSTLYPDSVDKLFLQFAVCQKESFNLFVHCI